MRLVPGLILVFVCASHVSAQSAYVGAAFIGDFVRGSGTSFDGNSTSGEAFGGALRVGTALGEQWGVELEFARTGEIETSPNVGILASSPRVTFSSGSTVSSVGAIFPVPEIHSDSQLSTLSTFLWWKQEFNDRFSLAYLGGVAFTRTEMDLSIRYDPFPLPPFPVPGGVPLPLPRPTDFETESVSYDANVALGLEGRIRMTDHVQLTPGIRMQTAVGAWVIRPGIGLSWVF